MLNHLFLMLFSAGLAFTCHADIYVLDAQSREDATHDYFVQLLQFSLDPVFRTTFKNKSAGKYLLSYQRWFAAAL